jgi:hypothetical protein
VAEDPKPAPDKSRVLRAEAIGLIVVALVLLAMIALRWGAR